MYLGAISFENSAYIYRRNEKLVAFLDFIIANSNDNDTKTFDLYKGLEKGRDFNNLASLKHMNFVLFLKNLMSIILSNYSDKFITNFEGNNDFLFDKIKYGPDQNVEQTFKILKKLSKDHQFE